MTYLRCSATSSQASDRRRDVGLSTVPSIDLDSEYLAYMTQSCHSFALQVEHRGVRDAVSTIEK
jgi:hypothetical protein